MMYSEGHNNSPSSKIRAVASQSSFTARCFVPETLIDYIHNRVKGELKPASFFIYGVCLLVDISGFTKLSGDFCAQGKNGIDGLQLATNGFMGKLVEIIYSYGGDIVKFAGDAIICIFYNKKRLSQTGDKVGFSLPPVAEGYNNNSQSLKIDSNSDKSEFTALHPSLSLKLPSEISDKGGKGFLGGNDCCTEDTETFGDKSERAVTASFRDNSIEPEIVLKAIRCALKLRDVETNKLTVHVAMSCGEICFGILGGYENRWECLISGQCLHQLSDCLDDAPSRHAALTPECYEVLRLASDAKPTTDPASGQETYNYLSQVQLERLNSGNYMILSAESTDGFGTEYIAETPRNTPLPPLVSQFVPVPISSGLEHITGLSYLAEIREVTTMFMKWESYDAQGKHRDLMQLQGYFHQAQKILHSTGAFLRQFLVDDKGCVLIACWGMPSLSYLDNPHRALSAAAQIRVKLGKMNMKCSFGITTGDVYCGTVGSALRMEYAAIGNVVNMSARLMSKAHEGIMIDSETYQRLPDNVSGSLEMLTPIMVKGRDEPLQVYKYSGEGSIQIGDDVVEDHEVREVCKTTFIKLLDSMKAPGRFSVFKRRQSISIVKDWISESVKRGGDLLSMNHASNPDTSTRNGIIRSSFRMSFGGSGGGSGRDSSRGTPFKALNAAVSNVSLTGPSSGGSSLSSRGSTHAGAGLAVQSSRRGSASFAASSRSGGTQQYQHDDISYRHIHEIPYVLMEGRRGAGKSSIVNWLKKQATDRQIPVFRARLSRDDVMVDYSVWMKVFRQLMPKDMFRSRSSQGQYVTNLLQLLYPDDPQTVEQVAFPSMQRAFGITCELDEQFRTDGSLGDQIKPSRLKIKVTSRIVNETLLKIFAHLLNEKPILLIIENIQFADEESLSVLLGLTHLHTLSAVVLTGLGPDAVSSKTSASVHTIQRIDSFDSEGPAAQDELTRNEWFGRFRGSVLFYDHATLITLDDFTPDEIDRMLCGALNVIQVPHEISQLVQDLSGGSFFWVKEIMHFLQEHGREEFMSAITAAEDADGSRRSYRRSGNGAGVGGLASPRNSPHTTSSLRILSQAVAFTKKSLMKRITSPESSVSVHGKTTKFKLELLVVCRFEKLSVEVQHVLRTASIIGVAFPTHILYGVLPSYLQHDMQVYVDALLKQKWIHQDADDESTYQFTHPYAHKIIYDLTPSSERNNMHQIIADYIEHMNYDDPAQYALLSSHNSHCNPEKAFHYTFKAITYLLDKGTSYEIGQCVDLLLEAVPHCTTVVDADVLRIMIYNVRKRVDDLGEDNSAGNSGKLAARAVGAMGGLFGAVSALSSRWRGAAGKGTPGKVGVFPPALEIIDEGYSTKSVAASFMSPRGPGDHEGAGAGAGPPPGMGSPSGKSFKNMVKLVIETNGPPPGSSSVTAGTTPASGSSKKAHSVAGTNNERAKAYFRDKLKKLDGIVDVKINELTQAGKYGEHKDWQHALIMQTPKKELPLVASPARFFQKAGSATKNLFAPFFRRSASLQSVISTNNEGGGAGADMSIASHMVEYGGAGADQSIRSMANNSVSRFDP